jgi:hypothetical protein
MYRNKIPHVPHHLGVPSGASKQFPSVWYVRRKLCTYLVSRLALSPKGPQRASTWASSPTSTIGYVQNYLWAYGTFGTNCVPILRQDWHYLRMNQNELALEPRHLGVPSGASKTILEPMVRSAQTVHLSCTYANSVSNRTKTRFHMTHVTW